MQQQAITSVQTAKAQVAMRKSELAAAQANIVQAESNLDAAMRRLARSETLSKEGAASLQDLDDDRARVRTARAAVAAVDVSRAVNKVSLVRTGPPTRAVGLRSTRAVLKSLVANATESLMLVSYAGYNVDDLAVTLAEAASRGVAVSLVLETHHDSGGGLSVDASAAFAAVGSHAHFYRWPLEARAAFFGSSASLHAKCVIADRSAALITSANLTSAGINDNIELGVLIEASPLPAKLHDHFEFLVEDGTLVRM